MALTESVFSRGVSLGSLDLDTLDAGLEQDSFGWLETSRNIDSLTSDLFAVPNGGSDAAGVQAPDALRDLPSWDTGGLPIAPLDFGLSDGLGSSFLGCENIAPPQTVSPAASSAPIKIKLVVPSSSRPAIPKAPTSRRTSRSGSVVADSGQKRTPLKSRRAASKESEVSSYFSRIAAGAKCVTRVSSSPQEAETRASKTRAARAAAVARLKAKRELWKTRPKTSTHYAERRQAANGRKRKGGRFVKKEREAFVAAPSTYEPAVTE